MPIFRDANGRFAAAPINPAERSLIDMDSDDLDAAITANANALPSATSSPIANTTQNHNDIIRTVPIVIPTTWQPTQTTAVPPVTVAASTNTSLTEQPVGATNIMESDTRSRYLFDRFQQVWSQAETAGDLSSTYERIASLFKLALPPATGEQSLVMNTVPQTVHSSIANPAQQSRQSVPLTTNTVQAPITHSCVQPPTSGHEYAPPNRSARPAQNANIAALRAQMENISRLILAEENKEPEANQGPIGEMRPRVQQQIHEYAPKIPFPVMKKDNIEMWFVQVEHWFQNYNVVDQKSKFRYIVPALEADQLTQVFDSINHPLVGFEFDNLKQAIIKTYADSEQRRIQKLIAGFKLGDYKPTQLLNIIRKHSENIYHRDSASVRQLWMNSLPEAVQVSMTAAMAVAPANTSLQTFAEAADKVMEQTRHESINAISSHHIAQKESNDLQEIRKFLESLNTRLGKIESRGRSRSRSGKPGLRSRSPSKNKIKPEHTHCYYHRKHGDKAFKCQQGCASWEEFSKKN